MKSFCLFVIVLGMTGCAAESKWVQEGKTPLQAEEDIFECENTLLRKHNNFAGLSDKEIDNLMDQCMKSKGYTAVSKSEY